MPEPMEVRRISAVPQALPIEWAEGGTSEFPSVWLLDNRTADRDAHSGQRLIDIADLPESPRIRSAGGRNGALHCEWEGVPPAASFELAWLAAHAWGRNARPPEQLRRYWLEGATLDARYDFAWARIAELRASAALRVSWLRRVT